MVNLVKYIFFICLSVILLISCTLTSNNARADDSVPNESFIQIISVLTVSKCDETKKKLKDCITGSWGRSASGMVIDLSTNHTLALTVGHICHIDLPSSVLESDTKISILAPNKKMYEADIVDFSLNEENKPDLCLIKIHKYKAPKVKMSKRKPKIGERYLSIGAPKGIYHPPVVPIFQGIFSGNLSNVSSMYTIRSAPGSSGSAVVDKNGEIVGVIYAVSTLFDSISLVTTFESTKKFLSEAKKKLPTPLPSQ
tara:strand:+ start:5211 stop:5972 length:762 start_codon:yes stop_codon:yes gene_type:complete